MPAKPHLEPASTVPVAQLAYAIREVETGGEPASTRYKTVNSIGATGAYQVMKGNIAEWTKEALGHSLTLDQWLGDKAAQDKVAMYKLGKSQKKYGSWESAAAVWFSGQPNPNSSASDGGNTVRQYVDKVGKVLKTGKTVDGSAGTDSVDTSGVMDSIGGALGAIAKPFTDLGTAMLSIGTFAEFLLKLALPSTWVRIVCGVFGLAFLMGGLVVLGQEAKGA